MNKVCFIVGGSRGLGKALLAQYQVAGYQCVDFSRSGSGAHHISVDLTRRESAIDAIDQQFARVAALQPEQVVLLINAAMLEPIGALSMSEPKQWWMNIDANMTLPISILGRFQWHFNTLAARKVAGFVSSGAAISAFDGWSLYCAAKAGVDHFIRAMALEQEAQSQPIECAILDPGVMDTQMQAAIRASSSEQFSQVQRFIDRHEAGGLAAPEQVAENIIAALAQPFANGSRIDVSG